MEAYILFVVDFINRCFRKQFDIDVMLVISLTLNHFCIFIKTIQILMCALSSPPSANYCVWWSLADSRYAGTALIVKKCFQPKKIFFNLDRIDISFCNNPCFHFFIINIWFYSEITTSWTIQSSTLSKNFILRGYWISDLSH